MKWLLASVLLATAIIARGDEGDESGGDKAPPSQDGGCGGDKASPSQAAITDREQWNAAVDAYRAGDATNALLKAKSLMAVREYKARAAEMVAKLAHESGDFETAAEAAQLALRDDPEDGKANRNYTRVTDGLAEKRERQHIDEVLAKSKGQDPGAAMAAAMREARQLLEVSGHYRTNEAARAVAMADDLEQRTRRLGDTLIPLRELIVQSVTNAEQQATIMNKIEAAKVTTKNAETAVADMDDSAYSKFAAVETAFTDFNKLVAMPPVAIAEGAECQTNALKGVKERYGRDPQRDALDYTRIFRARYPQWLQQVEMQQQQRAQSDTNAPPPISAKELGEKIAPLATELEMTQQQCLEKPDGTKRQHACDLLERIAALLPKDPSQGGSSGDRSQSQPQSQNDPGKSQDQSQEQQSQDQNLGKNDQDDGKQDQDKDKQQGAQEPKDEKPPEDKNVESILNQVKDRNDRHDERRRAMGRRRLSPDEKDW